MSSPSDWEAMLPKQATQATAFLAGRPDADGRGTLVAVLDTGVDPGAAGLATTPDGRPKIVDIIDCSGSGDVATTTVVKAEELAITGLSGAVLKLNAEWKNPSGDWRIGIKAGFEIFPGPLKTRLKADAKKDWDKANHAAEALATAAVSAWTVAHPEPAPSAEATREKEELDERVAQLGSIKFQYPGPVYDVVTWFDGVDWRAAVDVVGDGDLSKAAALTNFGKERQYASFGPELQLNYSIQIHEDGACTSICVDSGAHGTHVAGIIGAYRPDAPELNGIAPGCQIISCKIGDSRLDSMESLPALIRALSEVVKHKCDLINMSYGEAGTVANQGFFVKLAEEVTNKHGCIYVSSAGNAGPALTTAGNPGATSDSIFAVGAYVTDAMMRTCYSMPKSKTDGYNTNFTWTSVGPSSDGGRGTHIMAPGGAITCVPNWTLAHSQLMNGTSMSSPNACGNFALLLSACKAEGIKYTPHRVQRAIKNTGVKIPNVTPTAQGHGLLQVDDAYNYLKKFADDAVEDVEFKVTVRSPGGGALNRGVYLREAAMMAEPSMHYIEVHPKMHEDGPKADLVDFEVRIRLEVDAEYVEVPDQFLCAAKPRGFKIRVDPTQLAPGPHYANVLGYDAMSPERGPLFSVPITITKTLAVAADITTAATAVASSVVKETISMTRGDVKRIFVTPPSGSTWMDISVKINKVEPAGGKSIVVIHTVQLLPFRKYSSGESKNYVQLYAGQRQVLSRKIDGTNTVEVCVASYWNVTDAQEIDIECTFHGARPSSENLVIKGGSGIARTDVASDVREVTVNPVATLDKWQVPLRPTKAMITPLAEQWHLPEAKVLHQLELEYTMQVDEATEITPRCPGLNNVVYESELLGGPFYFVFDARKKMLGYGDIFPEAIKVGGKGAITIKAYLRHTSVELLKRYETLTMAVERKLPKKVTVNCYDSYAKVATNGAKFGKRTLPSGMVATVFFAEPEHKDLPKEAKAGDILVGTTTYAADDEKMPGAGKRPGGFPLSYTVPPAPPKKEEKKKPEAKDDRSDATKLAEAVRALTVKTLTELVGKDGFDTVYAGAEKEYAEYLPLVQAKLAHVDAEEGRKGRLPAVVAAADAVVAMIDATELALHFGTNVDADDVDAVKAQKEFEAKKKALIDALARKARAVGQQTNGGGGGGGGAAAAAAAAAADDADAGEFAAALKALKKWDKVDHSNHPKLSVEADAREGRHGNVLKAASAGLGKCTGAFDKELLEYRAAAYKQLGWDHAVQYERVCRLLNSPAAYPLF